MSFLHSRRDFNAGGRAGSGLLSGLRPRRAAGFTLVEVVVALVVLMVGIYAMLRIFPPGFQAIEVSQDRTMAAQLAEAELTRWKLRPEALPDAVVATDYAGRLIPATLTNDPAALQSILVYGELAARMPGSTAYNAVTLSREDLAFLDQLAPGLIYSPLDVISSQFDAALGRQGDGTVTVHPNWQPNSLYLPRTVLGERIDIRRLSRTGFGIPFHLMAEAPLGILRLEGGDDPATAEDDREAVYVDVYDAMDWSLVPWPTDAGGPLAAPPELKSREFALDPSTGDLHFGPNDAPPGDLRLFKVDYTDPYTLQRVIGMTVEVPPGGSVGATGLPAGVEAETVQVNERLQPVEVDERELLLVVDDTARRNIYYVDPESRISGRIEFPLVLQVDPRPSDITLVKVDYRCEDWCILKFDVEVGPDGLTRLPLTDIKGPGFMNPPRQERPQEIDRGIKHSYLGDGTELPADPADMNTWAYVVAVDRQSGEILVEHEGIQWPPNPYVRNKRFLVDYRNGILDFSYEPWEVEADYDPQVDILDRSGRTYRVFCRAEGDWAVQLMVAARRYGRSGTGRPGGDPIIPEGGSTGGLLTYAWRPDIDERQIYLPLSELGQAVAVDYYYLDPETAQPVYVDGEVHLVEGPNVTDLGEWVCRLSDPLEQEPYQWGPVRVRGISARARTLWMSPGQSTTLQDLSYALAQDPRPRARASLSELWHQVIVSTYLTQAPI